MRKRQPTITHVNVKVDTVQNDNGSWVFISAERSFYNNVGK